MDGDAEVTTMLDKRMVLLLAWCDGAKDAAPFRQVRVDDLTSRCSQLNGGAFMPIGHTTAVEIQFVQNPQRVGR